jgi:NhaA family Na+:H+ antiporter
MASAALALVVANSALAPSYTAALEAKVLGLSVLHWINDALMAVFFLLVGLEIKRELVDGELATWSDRALPGLAALGGMVVPAVIYAAVNAGDPQLLRGWAIPAATDIAFALGVLALLGSRIPVSLKIFLTALAIIDDLGAVLIIALVYTADLSPAMLGLAALTFAGLVALNRAGVRRLMPYLLLGIVLWGFVLRSGIHATIAGVLLPATIPVRPSPGRPEDPDSPLHVLEHALQRPVAYAILPIFGFANAGLPLAGLGLGALLHPVTLGVAAGLFIGKQVGVMLAVLAAVKMRLSDAPAGASWAQVYGVSLLCGIGFTMSLFVGNLAFPEAAELLAATKIGVLAGSLASAVVGFAVLRVAPRGPLPFRPDRT